MFSLPSSPPPLSAPLVCADDSLLRLVYKAAHTATGRGDPAAGAGAGGGGGADSQSDSYSEYLAAMEAERLDLQLAAEAEEEEAKRDAEALLPPPRGARGGGHRGCGWRDKLR